MKKVVFLILCITILICLVACNQGQNQTPTPEHTHSFSEWSVSKNATCTEEGVKVRYCDCGEKQSESIPTLNHTEVIDEAVPPTCTATGKTEGKHCSACNQVILAQSNIAKVEHTYSGDFDATCEVCGFTRNVNCSHNNVTILPAKDATCSKTGLTEGLICPSCNTVLIKQEVVPTLEHTYNDAYSFDSTFHWYACNDCGAKENVAEHQETDNGMCSVCDQPVGATEGIAYDVSADGTYAMVIAYNGTAQKIRIADTYQGLPVTTIYSNAFNQNNTITSVIIPDSVTTIGNDAFARCSVLSSVVIPDSVTSIGDGAFSGCSSLTSVIIGDNVTSIGGYAFYECRSLTSVVIPDSVTSISDEAFRFCFGLTSAVIGDSVTSIGNFAFEYCYELSSVVIGDSVTSIGHHAFGNCSKLQFNEYEYCKYLGSNDNPYIALIEVTTQNMSSYTIHEDTKVIAENVFYGCSRLTSIVIPDSVTSISNGAFSGCSGLKDVYYTGSEAEWKAIEIDSNGNTYLRNATIHYNYVPEN